MLPRSGVATQEYNPSGIGFKLDFLSWKFSELSDILNTILFCLNSLKCMLLLATMSSD